MKRELTPAQERCLLRKHLTGDFPARRWETIEVLIRKGYLVEESLAVTEKGREYCDTFHLDIRL